MLVAPKIKEAIEADLLNKIRNNKEIKRDIVEGLLSLEPEFDTSACILNKINNMNNELIQII